MMRRIATSAFTRTVGVSAASLSYKVRAKEFDFLFDEVLDMYGHFKQLGGETEVNKELVSSVVEEVSKLAENTMFPLYMSGDKEGCVLKDDIVTTPKGYKEAYKALSEAGWIGISSPAEFGGQNLPSSVGMIVKEMLATSNWAFGMYPGLTAGASNTLMAWGSEEQKKQVLPKFVDGTWSGTMCLTEPHCGTDLGQVKTKAVKNADGTYTLNGTKIFISAGDHDLTENVIHIVLAKLPGAVEGTKGISLFLVPRHLTKADGTLDTKKNVICTGLEEKMGIKASSTCQMTFDNSIGYLIGTESEGMKEMFTFMNAARLGTALQGVAHSELAFQNALAYARERRSMRALNGTVDKDAVADTIINHGNVRHNIMFAKAIAEAGRCFVFDMCKILDKYEAAPDAITKKAWDQELGLLTPIAKGWLTEMGQEAASHAQQVFGGHGFIKGNGMEQIARDARISTLYEGTTGIQALDLIGRKVLLAKNNEVNKLGAKINALAKANLFGKGEVSSMAWQLWIYQKSWKFLIARIKVGALKNKDFIGTASEDFLMASGYLMGAYYWLRMATVAHEKVAKKQDPEGFYQMKIDTANFYFQRVFPRMNAHVQICTSDAKTLMRVKQENLDL
eukprot:GILI01006279.1.p1 GENE.GILI01006279.1~~GILI01006279.1.p1  ORF type:complete len:620 (-),score=217.76 GILI01006279.1:333-2192(-)